MAFTLSGTTITQTGTDNISAIAGTSGTVVDVSNVAALARRLVVNGDLTIDRNIAFDSIYVSATGSLTCGEDDSGDFKSFFTIYTTKPVKQAWTSGMGFGAHGDFDIRNTLFKTNPSALSGGQGQIWGINNFIGLGGGANRSLKNVYFQGPPNRVGATIGLPEGSYDNVHFYDVDFVGLKAQPLLFNNVNIANSDWGLTQVDIASLSVEKSKVTRTTLQGNSGSVDQEWELTDFVVSERYMWRYKSRLASKYTLKKLFQPELGGANKAGVDVYIFNDSDVELSKFTTDVNGTDTPDAIHWLGFDRTSVGKTDSIASSGVYNNPDNIKNFVSASEVQTWIDTPTVSKFTTYELPLTIIGLSYDTLLFSAVITSLDPSDDGYRDTYKISTVPAPDVNVGAYTYTAANALTTIDDAEQFYARSKAFKVDTPTLPSKTTTLVARSGDTIDAGAFDVVIDATAGAAFAFAGTTITLKSSDFTGGISTTGTVTVSNNAGATLTGLKVTGVLDFDTAGTYTLDGGTINEATNSSGGNITLELTNGATVTTNTGPNITISNPATLTITDLQPGSDVVIYDASITADGSGSNVVTTFDAIAGTSVPYVYTSAPATINIGVFRQGYKPKQCAAYQQAQTPQ